TPFGPAAHALTQLLSGPNPLPPRIGTGRSPRVAAPGAPAASQSPYPQRSGSSTPRPDPRWSRLAPGQNKPYAPGTPGQDDDFGPNASMIDALNEWGGVVKDTRELGMMKAFADAGGKDAVVRVGPDDPQAKPLVDSQGSRGVEMRDGSQFWKMPLPWDPQPNWPNVQIRSVPNVHRAGDSVMQYRIDNGDWTLGSPPVLEHRMLPSWWPRL
ncbi:MAG: hypothetical protein JWM33_2403, partial [Caulobacteraceae bacterium]|nr:hypothetical protein [Caulobacteraceae bacterium]